METDTIVDPPSGCDQECRSKMVTSQASWGVQFENASFRYQDGADGNHALKNISFSVPPGRSLGLVGSSGKSYVILGRIAFLCQRRKLTSALLFAPLNSSFSMQTLDHIQFQQVLGKGMHGWIWNLFVFFSISESQPSTRLQCSKILTFPSLHTCSTIVRLLMRLYDVTSGRVIVRGRDVRQVSQRYLRENIGVVSQDTVSAFRTHGKI